MRRSSPALLLLLACAPILSQSTQTAYDRSLVIAPLYVNYTTDTDSEFARQARELKTRIGSSRGTLLGFAGYLRMQYPVTALDQPLRPESMAPTLRTLDLIVERARANQIVTHVAIISGFFHDSNALRESSIREDVRNAQWFSDGWIADPAELKQATAVPPSTWITPSRYARPLRSRIEEGARLVGAHLAELIAMYPETLVSASGDAEVEFSYERNIASGERRVTRGERVYADYGPFMVEEFRDWVLDSRYRGDLSPATDDNRDGRTFNRDYKQSFKTWKLRYYDSSGPIPFSDYLTLPNKLPSSGPFYSDGGFDAPRQEKQGDAYWELWEQFRKQVIANYIRDFAKWITSSGVPTSRFYSHQIPADFLFGEKESLRLKTSASYAESAVITPVGSAGVTVFNTYDGKSYKKTGSDPLFRLLSGSNWGIFEYNPSVPPSQDLDYYLKELRNLRQFKPHVLVPFAWTDDPGMANYRIKDSAFEKALRQLVTDFP